MILSILDEISSTTKKNEKLAILGKHKDNALFKKAVQLAYCPVTQFYIRQLPEVTEYTGKMIMDTGLNSLSELSTRNLTGGDAKRFLGSVLSNLNESDATVLRRVVLKDLRAGFSESSINKAMGKGTIKETPYMGAVSYSEKKVATLFKKHKRVFSEVKMDGRYSNVKITADSVFMESRGGKPTPLGGVFNNLSSLQSLFGYDVVINGELIIPGMDRYTSNGAIASLISIYGKIERGEDFGKVADKFVTTYDCKLEYMASQIKLIVWDFLPLRDYEDNGSWPVGRHNRLLALEGIIKQASLANLKFIEYREVKNVAEAMDHFKELLNSGEEGTILKGGDGLWKGGKPTHQVKFKLEMTVDLAITGFNYGTGKNSELVSSVNVKSSDGKITTSPCGIDDKTMKWITENQDYLHGCIVEVKCSGLSSNSKGEYSLLHPVFIDFRKDEKNVADSFEDIQANENMIKGLK